MGAKKEQTCARIRNAAQGLFAAKGFCSTTMKDISIAAEISRGGLYRHYPSTEVIFAEIIQKEQEFALQALQKAKEDGISPKRIIIGFLQYRVTYSLKNPQGFDNSISEFAANSSLGMQVVTERAKCSVKVLSSLIEEGIQQGQFNCNNCEALSKHIIWLMEGMCKHNAIIPLTAEDIEAQLDIIDSIL